ncbi:MAG: hypothetical protein LUE90_07785 [Clostridiales bacterium]|nr:hypothetical protein [Clostridiales bacterium]
MKNKVLISIIIVCILYGVIIYIFSIDIWDSLLFGLFSLFVAIGVPLIIMGWQGYKYLENDPKTALKWCGGALGYFFLIGAFIYLTTNDSSIKAIYTFYDDYTESNITIELYKDKTAIMYNDKYKYQISWNTDGTYIMLETGSYGYIYDNHIYYDYSDMRAKRNGIPLRKK